MKWVETTAYKTSYLVSYEATFNRVTMRISGWKEKTADGWRVQKWNLKYKIEGDTNTVQVKVPDGIRLNKLKSIALKLASESILAHIDSRLKVSRLRHKELSQSLGEVREQVLLATSEMVNPMHHSVHDEQ